ncbi:hypothetical protein PENTCL1PPCAC_7480, partial [Pristionchus entomophagus]
VMGRLSPIEEARMAHSYHNYSAIGFFTLAFALVPLLYTAYDHRRYAVQVPAHSLGWVFDVAVTAGRSWDVSIDEVEERHWDADFEYNQLAYQKYSEEEKDRVLSNPWAAYKYKEIIQAPERHRTRIPRSGSFATFLRETYHTKFGMTDMNVCHYKVGGRPNGLPSILRTFELSCSAQLLVRAVVLSTFYVRWYYTYLRCLTVLNTKTGGVLRALAVLTPKLQLAEMIFAFLITCFQQDNDQPLLWLFPIVVIGWAVSVCFYILVFSLMSMIDGGSESSSRLSQIRLACLSVCIFCSPIWIQNHLPFIKWKTCFTEVPIREALAEYATVAAVILFVTTQLYEMRHYWGLLSCSNHDHCVELNPEFSGVYRPAEVEIRAAAIRNRLTTSSSRKSSDVFLMGAMLA